MIKFVFFDFDGVFTNGDVYINDQYIDKKYNIKDGMGLSILRENNIKYGLISGFKKDFTINNDSFNLFTSHLKFDYVKTGISNKLQVLEEILKIENLTFDDIAYIGDDINDISILQKVKLSASPSDAIEECKNIVDYVCKNKGGDGCVREFVDYIIHYESKSNFIMDIKNDIKSEVIFQLNNLDLTEIELVVRIIKDSVLNQKIIYCSGVGKSENISIHCSNLMKSIGINSHYLNCLNSIHGDIGTIRKGDIILLFTKSGNTIELLNILPFLKLHEPYIICINCNKDGILNKLCDKSITLPFRNEIKCNINTIPTNSYTSMLFFINILITSLVNIMNINYDQYKMNHPGGNIGLNLKKISEIIQKEYPKIIFTNLVDSTYSINLYDILLEMTKYSIGCCFFVNDNEDLIGILTDGDIRRLQCINTDKKSIKLEDINKHFYFETDINKTYNDIKNIKKYKFIPILERKKIIGIIKY